MKLKLFPLNLVALPLKIIPLHIFEERYKKMIKDCIDKKKNLASYIKTKIHNLRLAALSLLKK